MKDIKISVEARHMEATDSIREYIESKVAKLPKIYDEIHSIEVILDMEADQPTVEVVVTASQKNTFVAKHRQEDMYACADQCLDKIVVQIRRHKDKIRHHHEHQRDQGLTDEAEK